MAFVGRKVGPQPWLNRSVLHLNSTHFSYLENWGVNHQICSVPKDATFTSTDLCQHRGCRTNPYAQIEHSQKEILHSSCFHQISKSLAAKWWPDPSKHSHTVLPRCHGNAWFCPAAPALCQLRVPCPRVDASTRQGLSLVQPQAALLWFVVHCIGQSSRWNTARIQKGSLGKFNLLQRLHVEGSKQTNA